MSALSRILAGKQGLSQLKQRGLQQWFIWCLVLVLILIGGVISPFYRSIDNLINIVRQLATPGILVIGQTLIILSGGIDLSNAGVVKLTSLLAAGLINGNDKLALPVVLLCLAIGGLVGLVNAFLSFKWRVPPFIATLATATILRGISLFYTTTVIGKASPAIRYLYYGTPFGIPMPAIILFIFVCLFAFILRSTKFGKEIYAVGGNEQTASLAGIRVYRVRVSAYVIGGILAAFGGLLILAKNGVGDPVVGEGLEMDSITAVILGGVSLMGGQGTLFGAFGGISALSITNNLINILRFDQWYQRLIKGMLIVIAVAIYKQKK